MTVMRNGRHQAADGGWWARRSTKGKLGVITAALLAISGIALALFFVLNGTTGSVTGASYQVLNASFTADTENPDCVVDSVTGETTHDLTWTAALPDDTCIIHQAFNAPASNSGDLVLQTYEGPAGLTVQMASTDDTGAPHDYCGETISPGATVGARVILTFTGDITDITFDPAVHGFQWVQPEDFDAGLCPPSS